MKFYILLLIFIVFMVANIAIAQTEKIAAKQLESKQIENTQLETKLNPKALLRNASTISVKSHSVYFDSGTLENALRKNSKFEKLGFTLIKSDTEADIVIEVERVLFTPVFTFRAIDRKTKIIVATGKATSIIGLRLIHSASSSMAGQFLNQANIAKK